MPTPDSSRGSAGFAAQPEAALSAFAGGRLPLPSPDTFSVQARAGAKLIYGLACDVAIDDRSTGTGTHSGEGAPATAPSPAQLLRASLSASLLMGCRRWAATLAVALDDLAVDITTDDCLPAATSPGEHATSGWTRIRIELRVQSREPRARVRAVVETAYRLNTVLALIARDVERVFLVHIGDTDAA